MDVSEGGVSRGYHTWHYLPGSDVGNKRADLVEARVHGVYDSIHVLLRKEAGCVMRSVVMEGMMMVGCDGGGYEGGGCEGGGCEGGGCEGGGCEGGGCGE